MNRYRILKNWAVTLGVVFVFIGIPFPPSSHCGGVGIHGAEPGKWWITGFYLTVIEYKRTTQGGTEICTMGIGWYVWIPLGLLFLVYGLYRNDQ